MALTRGFLDLIARELDGGSGSLAMLGATESRVTGDDLARVLARPTSTTAAENIPMHAIASELGFDRYVDFDLYGEPVVRCDLSQPLAPEHVGAFDAAVDLGTIEHVIDPLQALTNLASMVCTGGRVLLLSPAKIELNHGYYTLTPQLIVEFFAAAGFAPVTTKLVSYWGDYDRRRPFVRVVSPYEGWRVLHEPGVGLGLGRRVRRFARRGLADFSVGTLTFYVGRRTAESSARPGTRVQRQWQAPSADRGE